MSTGMFDSVTYAMRAEIVAGQMQAVLLRDKAVGRRLVEDLAALPQPLAGELLQRILCWCAWSPGNDAVRPELPVLRAVQEAFRAAWGTCNDDADDTAREGTYDQIFG